MSQTREGIHRSIVRRSDDDFLHIIERHCLHGVDYQSIHAADLAELKTLGELTRRASKHDGQVIVEGPGHVPLDQIEFKVK